MQSLPTQKSTKIYLKQSYKSSKAKPQSKSAKSTSKHEAKSIPNDESKAKLILAQQPQGQNVIFAFGRFDKKKLFINFEEDDNIYDIMLHCNQLNWI